MFDANWKEAFKTYQIIAALEKKYDTEKINYKLILSKKILNFKKKILN